MNLGMNYDIFVDTDIQPTITGNDDAYLVVGLKYHFTCLIDWFEDVTFTWTLNNHTIPEYPEDLQGSENNEATFSSSLIYTVSKTDDVFDLICSATSSSLYGVNAYLSRAIHGEKIGKLKTFFCN